MDNELKQNSHAQDVRNGIDEIAVSLRRWLGCVDRFNATAKQHLFNNGLTLTGLIKELLDNDLKEQINKRLEAMLSWHPLINDHDQPATEKQNH